MGLLIKNELLDLIADFLEIDVEELSDDRSLESLNIDSLTFTEIMFEVEDEYDVSLLSQMQSQREQLSTFGNVLALTLEIINKQRGSGAT